MQKSHLALTKILDQSGEPIDATFSAQKSGLFWVVVLESRGGTKKTSNARNLDYTQGLALLLTRAQSLQGQLIDAFVDTKVTRQMSLSREDTRLKLSHDYPVVLRDVDIQSLRIEIGRAQRPIGRKPDATGSGNNTKRVVFYFRFYDNVEDITGLLAGWATPAFKFDFDEADFLEEFEPHDIEDARKKRQRSIVLRQGQPAFRNKLLAAYEGKCCISGFDVHAALQAAHIFPYLGQKTNTTSNGLLLRADIHVLFDRGLLTIDPSTWQVLLAGVIMDSSYSLFQHKKIFLPNQRSDRPNPQAVKQHYDASVESWKLQQEDSRHNATNKI